MDQAPETADELAPLPSTAPWWATYLVSNWHQMYKWASTWFIGALAAVPMLQEALPQFKLDQRWDHALTVLLAVLAIAARVTNQAPKDPK